MGPVRVHDDEPPRARERAAEILRASRARLMVDRRVQTAVAACLASVLAVSVHGMVTAPGPSAGTVPSTTTVRVPPDHRVVTIPVGSPLPGVVPGSRVDLVARSSLLVADAVVTGTGQGTVSVAVPAGSAPVVADAASIGDVWVVLRPG